MNNKEYLIVAIDIAEELLSKAKKTENGFTWDVMHSNVNSEISWQPSDSIYSGNAGIVLFYLELHKRTQDSRYLEAVVEGARWLEHECGTTETDYYAFYTGRMGIAYTMLLLSEYLNEDRYKHLALDIAKKCGVFLQSERMIDDLINGISGTLLGLLHIHAKTKDVTILKLIEQYTEELIRRANITEHGFYWDRSGNNIDGLCGFSHGASGVGYVFLELARYFSNETFNYIAEQAFAYENHHFNTEANNWPDLRRAFYDEKSLTESKKKYASNDKSYFIKPGHMSAWCHGAPGIGLSRVRAYELLGKPEYLHDLKNAIENTRISVSGDVQMNSLCVICHGISGNAILFLEAARVLKDESYILMAREAADNIIACKKHTGIFLSGYSFAHEESDNSLFMGNAGIGYYMTLLSDPAPTAPSLLKPDVDAEPTVCKEGILSWDLQEVIRFVGKGIYPRTTSFLNTSVHLPELADESFLHLLDAAYSGAISKDNNDSIKEVWEFEKRIRMHDLEVESHAYHRVRRMVEVENNKKGLDNDNVLLNSVLFLPEDHLIIDMPEQVDSENGYLILLPAADLQLEFPLNDFAYAVISQFQAPRIVRDVIAEMIEEFEVSTPAEIRQVEEATIMQIKEALAQGILFTGIPQPTLT